MELRRQDNNRMRKYCESPTECKKEPEQHCSLCNMNFCVNHFQSHVCNTNMHAARRILDQQKKAMRSVFNSPSNLGTVNSGLTSANMEIGEMVTTNHFSSSFPSSRPRSPSPIQPSNENICERQKRIRKQTERFDPSKNETENQNKMKKYREDNIQKKEAQMTARKNAERINEKRVKYNPGDNRRGLPILDFLAEMIHSAYTASANRDDNSRSTTAVVLTEDNKLYCFTQRFYTQITGMITNLNEEYGLKIILIKESEIKNRHIKKFRNNTNFHAECLAYRAWVFGIIRRIIAIGVSKNICSRCWQLLEQGTITSKRTVLIKKTRLLAGYTKAWDHPYAYTHYSIPNQIQPLPYYVRESNEKRDNRIDRRSRPSSPELSRPLIEPCKICKTTMTDQLICADCLVKPLKEVYKSALDNSFNFSMNHEDPVLEPMGDSYSCVRAPSCSGNLILEDNIEKSYKCNKCGYIVWG